MGLEESHGVHDLLIDARSPASVVGGFEPLQADGGDEVLYAQHFLTERLIDERPVGEGEELTVRVQLTQADQVILADHRFPAGVDIHIGAQLLPLADDGIQGIQVQAQIVAILGGPTAGTAEVAGRSGVQQDSPGHITVILGHVLLLRGAPLQAGVDNEILEKRLADARIQFIKAQDELIPVVFCRDGLPKGPALRDIPVLRAEPVHQVHDLGDVSLRVLFQIIEGRTHSGGNGGTLCLLRDSHGCISILSAPVFPLRGPSHRSFSLPLSYRRPPLLSPDNHTGL